MNQINSQRIRQIAGFTLLELLVGMAITAITSTLAMQAILQIGKTFNEDQKTVANGQKMSSVLEIIGREIRQAGEYLPESDFPMIQVTPRGTKGASIVVYRATSNPVNICRQYNVGLLTSEFVFATDKSVVGAPNVANPVCTVETTYLAAPTDIFPLEQKNGWITPRSLSSISIGSNPVLLGAIYNSSSRSLQPFVYTGEEKIVGGSLTLKIKTVDFTPTSNITIGSTAYLVEKREYLVCGNNLIVRSNSTVQAASVATGVDPSAADPACKAPIPASDPTATVDTVATNIEKLNISMITRAIATTASPNPASEIKAENASFPIPPTSPISGDERIWQNIQGIKINLKPLDPLGKSTGNAIGRNASSLSADDIAKFSSEGTFYPRNVLSSK
jgi:prepilin-type N-terminal cleavage/methylation domain-containing protein